MNIDYNEKKEIIDEKINKINEIIDYYLIHPKKRRKKLIIDDCNKYYLIKITNKFIIKYLINNENCVLIFPDDIRIQNIYNKQLNENLNKLIDKYKEDLLIKKL